MTKNSNMSRLFAITALSTVFIAAPTVAQEFEGAYVGGEAGIGILKAKGTTILGPFSTSDNSAIINGFVGYRAPVGAGSQFVLGAEALGGFYSEGTNFRYGFYGIGGFRVGDSGLVYGRLGYSWLNDIQTGFGKGIDGLTFGGGYEFRLGETTNLRLDYRFIDFDSFSVPDNRIDFDGHEITAGIVLNF